MRVTKAKAAENRERILTGAARLFREQGLSGVGVDALAGAAGLTHGSLYSQFGSKERLAEEALRHALRTSAERMGDARTLEDYVARYLTPEHRDRRGDGCVVAALGSEMPRHGSAIRRGFTDAVRAMAGRLAGLMPGRRSPEDAAPGDAAAEDAAPGDAAAEDAAPGDAAAEVAAPGDAALAAAATMIGALILARAVDDPALSDRILAAARGHLMSR